MGDNIKFCLIDCLPVHLVSACRWWKNLKDLNNADAEETYERSQYLNCDSTVGSVEVP